MTKCYNDFLTMVKQIYKTSKHIEDASVLSSLLLRFMSFDVVE